MTSTRARRADSVPEVGVAEAATVSDIETIVAKAVKAAITVVREEFDKRYNEMKDYIKHLEQRIDALESAENPVAADTSDLHKKLDAIKLENRRVEIAANETEQYGRRNNLRVKGLVINNPGDCRQAAVDFIRGTLKVPIEDDDIDVAHPIPNRSSGTYHTNPDQDNPRQRHEVVLIRFHRRTIRDKVIRQRRLLKNTRHSIVEDLTSLNLQVINRLKRSEQVDKTWSWNGHIYALLKNGRKMQVQPYQPIGPDD